ncbi:hypothetical protein [Phenylobacterium sp.]|uniref:hypothetical protein n=1 Tax=Phenylobacterium sp. TaxID=1871053 RepID=UPI0035678BF6
MAYSKSPKLAAAVIAAMALAAPGLAWAQSAGGDRAADPPGTRFRCQDGGDILARFASQDGQLVAIVDAFDGDGPHTLAWTPFTGGPIKLTWSDGRRTLTWSPGVQIMWMAADVHRMCGRAGHHH